MPPAALEAIIEASGIATRIEALLPAGVRRRQLKASTLILGMMLTQADRRPAHLTEIHAALTALPPADQCRLGVTEDWKTGPHQLTYRQAERTFDLALAAGAPSRVLGASHTIPAPNQPLQAAQPGRLPSYELAEQAASDQLQASLAQPGRIEDAVRNLQVSEPALLLRATAIDEAARGLLAEGIAKAHRRTASLGPPGPVVPQPASPPPVGHGRPVR
jgi:hypothetical protein